MSWITYRGIQKYAQAPVELFIFPGEGHEPVEVAHWRRKMIEDQAWFEEYFWNAD
jgi:dipeptidyl aminopeptidase/acylaminoacyl peptidase